MLTTMSTAAKTIVYDKAASGEDLFEAINRTSDSVFHSALGINAALNVQFNNEAFVFDNGLAEIVICVPLKHFDNDLVLSPLTACERVHGIGETGPAVSRRKNQLVLISHGHRYEHQSEVSLSPAADFLHIEPTWLGHLAQGVCDVESDMTSLQTKTSYQLDDEVLRARANAYLNFVRNGQSSELLGDTLRHMIGVCLLMRQSLSLPKKRLRCNPLPVQSFLRIHDYIDARLACSIGLSELAHIANLSEHHFLRSFKLATGMTPHQFVLGKRIERAKTLLKRTQLPIAQVASDSGFASQSHMTQIFTARMGTTPSNYRLQC
jgi:AraC-like DNA-binding protein